MGCKYLTDGALGQARRLTSLAGDAPVAGRARSHGNHPRAAHLAARIKDYEQCRTQRHDMKVQMRIDNGGFHRPGSLQR